MNLGVFTNIPFNIDNQVYTTSVPKKQRYEICIFFQYLPPPLYEYFLLISFTPSTYLSSYILYTPLRPQQKRRETPGQLPEMH